MLSTLVGRFRTVLLAVAWLLGGASGALAQNTVNLQGRVTATDGNPLAAAQVTVSNRETGQQRGAITSAQGTYAIVGLPPGAYHVRLVLLGYRAQERDIELLVGQRASLDFQLQEAAVAVEGIEVTHQREPVFEVQRNDVSAPVVTNEILNLPLNTRNTINLAAVVPGMKTFAPTAGRSLPASGSLPDLRFWNFYLDGAEWKSFFNGNLVGIPQTGSPLPQEAMREFRVHLNPYDAQYTRGASFVISAVTQRGTNEFHGSVFGYGQSNALKALDLTQREARTRNPTTFSIPDYTRAQFGFNVRGPIRRDKLFVAASYEGQSIDDGITVLPGRPAYQPDIWDAFAGTFKAPTKNHTGVVRLTAPLGVAHTLDAVWAGRYYNSETNFGGTGARNSGINAKYWVHSAQLRDTYTPTSGFVNELSLNVLSWSHNESPLEPGVTLVYPSITFGTAGFPLVLKETHVRVIDRATHTLGEGRHILTGGLELARVHTNSWLPSNRDGFFQFPRDTSSLPSLGRIGVGFFDTTSTEDARAVTSGWSTGAYVQDQWQARRSLQLTAGLRYDAEINTLNNGYTVPWASVPELQAIPQLRNFLNTGHRKNDLNNIGPRLAFSWDVFDNQRTFLRGGAGIMYDRITTFMAFFEKQSAGWRTYEFTNPGTADPDTLRQRVLSGAATSKLNFNLLKTNMKTPENHQFSVGIGHQLTDRIALNVDYIHQDARNLYVQLTPNWFNTVDSVRALTDSFATITLYDDIGRAKFDALIGGLTYDRPGLRLNAALTLGWYKSQFEGLGNYNDATFLLMQPTTADERWRLVFSGIGDLPLAIKLSAVAIFAAPRPYVATVGQDLNHDITLADDFVGGNASRTIRPVASWNNMYRTFDLRLAKGVSVGGGRKISASAEAFNIFNWDNYSGFVGRQTDALFGKKSGVFAPRQGQLGMRYEF
ncbi:MAG TPA: carboxypeptidase regulatory-like domain-containing protein [Gemmatimonadales bacterium]|nr:carboxypeptidase regulatory-like domain-containing protein [Gemmatimonadales bacterium]